MSYGFDGGRVAGDLMTMPNDLQKRLGEILFAVVGTWAELAPVVVDGYGPSHPLYNECLAARVMLSHLFPNSRAMLND